MSHVTDMKFRVKDDQLDLLKSLLAERFKHLEFRENKKEQAWYGQFVGDSAPPLGRDPKDYGKAEHTIGRLGYVPRNGAGGEYEIGLVRALDGNGYDMLLDSWGPGAHLANELPKLRREFSAAVATQKVEEELAMEGCYVDREELTTGAIRLKVRRR